MTDPLEIVVVLDVNAPVPENEYKHLLSQERRETRRFHLSDHGAPAPRSGDGSLPRPNWAVLGRAVENLAACVQEAMNEAGDQPVEFYFVAKAPLPLCAQFGAALPRLRTTGVQMFVLNPRRGGPWERYPMRADGVVARTDFFDEVDGLVLKRADPAQGCVAVVLSTVGGAVREDAIGALLRERGEPLARIVRITTSDTMNVTPDNAPAIAELLRSSLPILQNNYPHASSFGLFIAGPVPLAFMVGQSINGHQFADGKLWFANFDKGRYEYALSLPFRVPGQISIPDSAEDREARRAVLDRLTDGIEELKKSLKVDDLPFWVESSRRQRLLSFLRDLKVAKEPGGDEFGLDVLQRRISLGRGLAEALRSKTEEVQRGFGQLLLLHEIFHDGQTLRTSNYYGVGRAGVALEQVDFDADAFALATLIKWSLRRGGEQAQERPGEHGEQWVSVMLEGLFAFDQAEQRERMERLYERRLRRYLVWFLQRARAKTLRSPDDVDTLFQGRLTVELAPLAGHLDERADKLVQGARSDTELFVVLDGHLLRQSQNFHYPLASLVDSVRTFDRDGQVALMMSKLVDAHRSELIPWAAEGAF